MVLLEIPIQILSHFQVGKDEGKTKQKTKANAKESTCWDQGDEERDEQQRAGLSFVFHIVITSSPNNILAIMYFVMVRPIKTFELIGTTFCSLSCDDQCYHEQSFLSSNTDCNVDSEGSSHFGALG